MKYTIKHLQSDHINKIALGLDEDVYGANGDLDEFEIRRCLIENIHDATGHQYVESGMMPVWQVANLIQSVWEAKDRDCMELEAMAAALPETIPLGDC